MRPILYKSRWALGIVAMYAVIGMFNSLIANDQPILAKTQHQWHFPAFEDLWRDWGLSSTLSMPRKDVYEFAVYPPIRFKAATIDTEHAGFQSPVSVADQGHFLGTDQLGRDVAAGIVRGCYTSFRIGLLATLFCALLGIGIGMAMGYFGNRGIRLNGLQALLLGGWMFFTVYFLFYPPFEWNWMGWLISLGWIVMFVIAMVGLEKAGSRRIHLPFDGGFTRIIALRRSVPTLILLLVLFPLFERPHVNNVILVILILGWTSFARHARAETLSIKEREFVLASRIMGSGHWNILRSHILPNIMPTMVLLMAMNFAGNILLESTLSFLGMGLPPEEVSWGSLLSEARKNPYAWWMVIFPGLSLFVLVFTINKLTDQYLEKDA